MAEDAHVLRGINWRETFPFTHIFRSFRIAIHPSKLILALLALLGLYVGGRVLDGIWPARDRAVATLPRPQGEAAMPVPSEVDAYRRSLLGPQSLSFAEQRERQRESLEQEYATNFLERVWEKDGDQVQKDHKAAMEWAKSGKGLGDVKDRIVAQRDRAIKAREEQYAKDKDAAIKATEKNDDATRRDALRTVEDEHKAGVSRIYSKASTEYQQAKLIEGQGLFEQFFDYEVSQVNGVVEGVKNNNWLAAREGPAVIPSVEGFFTVGPLWLVNAHWVYFILYSLLFLIIWSVFGGAICRIAAVHVARDEKLSLKAAVKFSLSKFLSFIFAPIIPLVIVLVVGLVVLVGGLVGNIPVVGPWLVGALFFLALGAGFVMTLVLIGTIGGFNLMYPTIAVEGSDSFDAISRSFSYVYARPWRMVFYTVVAVIYGALTYMFVKFFLALMLGLTHYFVGKGFFKSADDGRQLWNALWPGPSGPPRNELVYDVDFLSLTGPQKVAAGMLSFWIYMVIAMLGAFAVSFYFSANTIIYYLMRREVDATELDDVYLEQSEEEFETAPAATAPAASSGTGVTVPLTTSAQPTSAAPVAPVTPAPSDAPQP